MNSILVTALIIFGMLHWITKDAEHHNNIDEEWVHKVTGWIVAGCALGLILGGLS